MADLHYYLVDDSHKATVIQLFEEQDKRLQAMSKWFEKNLPGFGEGNGQNQFALEIDHNGLHAIEYYGALPEGFKRQRQRMISPKKSHPKGKEIAAAWKEFKMSDFRSILDTLKIPAWEIGPKLQSWHPNFSVFDNKVYLRTLLPYKRKGLQAIEEWQFIKAETEASTTKKQAKKARKAKS